MIKIRGIVTNILQNTVRAIGLKGEINVSVKVDSEYATIIITDSGFGMPEENTGQIFEPMFTTKDEGTDLELASCKQFLDMYGGTINVSNDPIIFTIKLPKTRPDST